MTGRVRKTHMPNFVAMLFGNGYTSKAISSILLVALLLIHSVRLLHSHANDTFCSKDLQSSSVVKNNPDCSVCSYQLAKDTDAQNSFDYDTYVLFEDIIGQHLESFYKPLFSSAFENRGPPCI
jgi:hypothetical protein